jgi:3-methyladenine DNA glycosylase/8-oxoguanine DNA glycosylase
MHQTTLTIKKPSNFNFWRTVYSHGWCALPPFHIDKERRILHRVLVVSEGNRLVCSLTDRDLSIVVRIQSTDSLTAVQRRDVRSQLADILRLNENFSDFYVEARRHKDYRWIANLGAGRLLRAPTVFEDVVKMICTTNCTWGLTEMMVKNLTMKLGRHVRDGFYAFPTSESIAGCSESFMRKEIKTGYRSPYLLELAKAVSAKELDIESWRGSSLPTEELFDQIHSVKGVGPYAAGNILKLVGRYDYLGLDSWVRKKYFELHHNGRTVKDTTIERHYASLGKWKGLFFWLEMTQDWYSEKFPF